MNCHELVRLLADYSDGAVPESVCNELDRHLRECASCAELLRELGAVERVCRESAAPLLPPEVRQRILGMLRGATPR